MKKLIKISATYPINTKDAGNLLFQYLQDWAEKLVKDEILTIEEVPNYLREARNELTKISSMYEQKIQREMFKDLKNGPFTSLVRQKTEKYEEKLKKKKK